MARWGNALGGWRRQKRGKGGRWGSGGISNPKSAAKSQYKAAKKRNNAAHKARFKGSVKARGREFFDTAPRRSRNIVAGAAQYGAGYAIQSRALQSRGTVNVKRGVSAGAGRVNATRKMSKGLRDSRNRQAKDRYYKSIGTTRARQNAKKAAAAGIAIAGVAGLGYAAHKRGNVGVGNFPSAGRQAYVKAGSVKIRSDFHSGPGGYIANVKYQRGRGRTRTYGVANTALATSFHLGGRNAYVRMKV